MTTCATCTVRYLHTPDGELGHYTTFRHWPVANEGGQ